MAREVEDDDWDGDDWGEEPADDDDATTPCPYCGQPIYEDAPRCPHCERYVSAEDAPPPRKPWWVIAGLFACLLCAYLWVVR